MDRYPGGLHDRRSDGTIRRVTATSTFTPDDNRETYVFTNYSTPRRDQQGSQTPWPDAPYWVSEAEDSGVTTADGSSSRESSRPAEPRLDTRSEPSRRRVRSAGRAISTSSSSTTLDMAPHAPRPTRHIDVATYQQLTTPAPARVVETQPAMSNDEWWDVNQGMFHSVTLKDGRVAERDRGSGHWRWRDTSNTTLDDTSSATLSRKKRRSRSSTHSASSSYRTSSPPPPLPADAKMIGHLSSMPRPVSPQPLPQQPNPTTPPSIFANSSRLHEIIFIILVCAAQFLALAGLSQTVSPLPLLGANFHITDPGTLSWYTAAFSLTVGTFILPAGRIGDMLGHKRIYILGWLWYATWSLITGLSSHSSSIVFTTSRALQGIGPALLVPNAMALIAVSLPPGKKRNLIFAFFGSMGPTGFVTGSVCSSFLAQYAKWEWSFYALSITSFLLAMLSYFLIPSATKKSSATITGSFDYPGALTGVPALILINFAINQAPLSSWSDLYIPVLLVVGLALLALFVFIERRVAAHPLVPFAALSTDGLFALACIAAGWASHGIWLYYLFLLQSQIHHLSPLEAAVRITPVAVVGVIFALGTGVLVQKIRTGFIMCVAMAGFGIGILLLALAPPEQGYWGCVFISVLVTPLGMNLSFPAGTVLMASSLPRERQGVAASLVATVVNYSISTGLGVAGTVDRYVTASAVKGDGGFGDQSTLLRGYRAAWFFGLALDGVGLVIAGWYVWKSRVRARVVESKA